VKCRQCSFIFAEARLVLGENNQLPEAYATIAMGDGKAVADQFLAALEEAQGTVDFCQGENEIGADSGLVLEASLKP
jgi:hypothetical protein